MNRIEKLNEMLANAPDDSFLQHALALEYIKTGNDAKAKELFENILKREPSYVGSYYHLGKLLERQTNNEEAIKIYEQGISECRKVNDRHSMSELQSALDELL